MGRRRCWSGLLVAIGIGLCAGAAYAEPATPPPGYEIDKEYTKPSPDGALAIEQYLNKETDDWKWQFWLRRQGALTLLDPEPAGYPADFVFTRDSQWVVRLQKIGSGTSTIFLYRLSPKGNVFASAKPLGDLAWKFLKSRPEWRKVVKPPEYHISAHIADGFGADYRKLGIDWPANRYVLISLYGEADVKGRKPMQTGVVNGWRCRYDLQTGTFDVPPLFSRSNAKAFRLD